MHKLAVNMASLERKQMRMQIAEEGLRLGTIGGSASGRCCKRCGKMGARFTSSMNASSVWLGRASSRRRSASK